MINKIILFGENHRDPSSIRFLYHLLPKIHKKDLGFFVETCSEIKNISYFQNSINRGIALKDKLSVSGKETYEELQCIMTENKIPNYLHMRQIIFDVGRLKHNLCLFFCIALLKKLDIEIVEIDLCLTAKEKNSDVNFHENLLHFKKLRNKAVKLQENVSKTSTEEHKTTKKLLKDIKRYRTQNKIKQRIREKHMVEEIYLSDHSIGIVLLGAAHVFPVKKLLSKRGIEVLDIAIFNNKIDEVDEGIENRFDVSKNEDEVYLKVEDLISDFIGIEKTDDIGQNCHELDNLVSDFMNYNKRVDSFMTCVVINKGKRESCYKYFN
ncbi:MAG: hypothetical protein HRK26_05450 [Rickettsiaceae bacterium H1]|nr:hypothetical protein [Rickettsiaceae bacterium H1]